MSFFSPADAGPQQQAILQAGLAQTGIAAANQNLIQDYANRGLGFLNTGYGGARADITGNFAPALAAVQGGYGAAIPAVQSNYATGLDQISKGISGYEPYAGTGNTANAMYSGALGLGGAAGTDAARAAFTASPQYQWNLDQATGNAVRGANRYGMGTSGNTLDAITRLGSNLASGEYTNWLNNLNTVAGRGLSAVGGQAGLYGTGAQLSANLGNNLGNLYTGQGKDVGSLYGTLGSNLGNLDVGLGTGSANLLGQSGRDIVQQSTHLGDVLSKGLSDSATAQTAADTANRNWQLGLGGLGLQAAGIAAAPFTGGTSLGLSGLFGSSGLGGIGSGLSSSGSGLFSGLGFNPFGSTSGFRGA